MAAGSTLKTAIFERIVMTDDASNLESAARSALALDFSPEDRQRMEVLAEKARAGTLSEGEEEEIDSYERVGHYLAILQSKAQVILDRGTSHDS